MALKEITVNYTLINNGSNTVTCKNVLMSVSIEPGETGSIQVCFSGSTVFMVTESNNPSIPLTVTLTQISDTSIDITPSSNNWQITENDNEWLCQVVGANKEIEDQQTYPTTASGENGVIVIVGTVEILEPAHQE